MLVGLRDWTHPALGEGYYPDDLPEDWRLSYYANEFLAVLVPQIAWRALEREELAAWVDDAPERFRFFLESSDPAAGVCPDTSVLGDRLGGFVRWVCDGPGAVYRLGRVNSADGADAGIAWLLKDEPMPGLPVLRECLEDALQANRLPSAVFLDPAPPAAPEQARQIQVLADLLGYSG